MTTVFAFDFGTGSLAAVIRHNHDIIFKKSYVMDQKFASTESAALKRRAVRTRKAHRAREYWWNKQAVALGLPVLKQMITTDSGDYRTIAVDERLKREFPSSGDETIYCSALLRIVILEGRIGELADWQIYKAVHSAMQKRGYDENIPWKTVTKKAAKGSQDNTDEAESLKVSAFQKYLKELNFQDSYHFCCYFEAFKMGLWQPKLGITRHRIDHFAEAACDDSGKGYTPPRKMVEDELRKILLEIKKVKPALDVDLVLFGPGRKAYASHESKNPCGLKRGHETDWHGLLGQKIPRFDNRIIDKCLLMPRFNVCKAIEPLYQEFHFASALHKLRVREHDSPTIIRPLAHSEYRYLYDHFANKWRATGKQLEKALMQCGGLEFAGESYGIDAAKSGGRTSFCRPSLQLLIELLTKGLSPAELLTAALARPRAHGHSVSISDNRDPTKGLIAADLEWLRQISDRSWEEFYLPQTKLDQRYHDPDPRQAIGKVIGSVNNPVVRHRLSLLVNTLETMKGALKATTGKDEPDSVVFEVIRDDFMGEKAKLKLKKFQNERKKSNSEAKEQAAVLGIAGENGPKKFQLFKRQGGICLYSGNNIAESDIEHCEIDHIVPRERGGPDSFYNMVLTIRTENQNKGVRTPFEWLASDERRWHQFHNRVLALKTLPRKVTELLISADAYALVEKYTNLAETAYISRLANTIIHLSFGWMPSHLEGKKKIHFITGGLTARVRRKYDLNGILSDSGEKNRKDKRHHLLDALVLSFIPGWSRQRDRTHFFRLPDGIDKSFFAAHICTHTPIKLPDRPQLEENFYGKHSTGYMTKRTELKELAYKDVNMKQKFNLDSLNKKIEKLKNIYGTTEIVANLVEKQAQLLHLEDKERHWLEWCQYIHLKSGSKLRKVKIPDAISDECKIVQAGPLGGLQILKPKRNHRGFFIYLDKGKTWKAKAIYAHESIFQGRQRLQADGIEFLNENILRSGAIISINNAFEKFHAGAYRLKTIKNGVTAEISPIAEPTMVLSVGINKLVRDGKFTQLTPETSS